jgi:hypothetical protein
MPLRPNRLLGRTLKSTFATVGSLAMKLGVARKVLLIVAFTIVALVVVGGLLLTLVFS